MANEDLKVKDEFVTKAQLHYLKTDLESKEKDAKRFADRFQTALGESLPMNKALAKAICRIIETDDKVKTQISQIVETVNHSKWKLIYSKTWIFIAGIVTLALGSVLGAFLTKIFSS